MRRSVRPKRCSWSGTPHPRLLELLSLSPHLSSRWPSVLPTLMMPKRTTTHKKRMKKNPKMSSLNLHPETATSLRRKRRKMEIMNTNLLRTIARSQFQCPRSSLQQFNLTITTVIPKLKMKSLTTIQRTNECINQHLY
jgi:hypothetical protein